MKHTTWFCNAKPLQYRHEMSMDKLLVGLWHLRNSCNSRPAKPIWHVYIYIYIQYIKKEAVYIKPIIHMISQFPSSPNRRHFWFSGMKWWTWSQLPIDSQPVLHQGLMLLSWQTVTYRQERVHKKKPRDVTCGMLPLPVTVTTRILVHWICSFQLLTGNDTYIRMMRAITGGNIYKNIYQDTRIPLDAYQYVAFDWLLAFDIQSVKKNNIVIFRSNLQGPMMTTTRTIYTHLLSWITQGLS